MNCPWAGPVGLIAQTVTSHISEVAPDTYGNSMGVVVVHYCEHCDCCHVSTINSHRGRATERAVRALQTALIQLVEETENEQRNAKSIETSGGEVRRSN